MLIPETLKRCSVFLTTTVEGERRPVGTAFLVAVPVKDGSIGFVVTAQHNVNAARPRGALFVRANRTSGGFHDIATDPDDWVLSHETDVAVLQMHLSEGYESKYLPIERLASDDYVRERRIGEGDEVFITGLFAPEPGEASIQPIVRFGTISRMPSEGLPLRLDPSSDTRRRMPAYLVEARSWGGHSGSPAFVYYLPTREEGFLELHNQGAGSQIMLLGLVHGHYDLPAEVRFEGDVMGSGSVNINAGIAVVVPAQGIIDLLMSKEVLGRSVPGEFQEP